MAAARDRTIALLITLLMVVSAGCSRGDGPSTPTAQLGTPAAEVSTPEATEAQPTEPSEPADPYAIPADPNDIDEQYVELVVEALNEGVVAATREIGKHQQLTPAAQDALAATHLAGSRRGYVASFRRVLSDKKTSGQLRSDAQSVDVLKVKEVITATEDCIFTLVRQDTSGLVNRPVEPFDVYYHLSAAETPNAQLNPTPWMVAADAQPRSDGKEFEDPCADS